tara:strand:- start:93 stop:812 length:720 start_codon:yes stop_codon:yes gene_type:complete
MRVLGKITTVLFFIFSAELLFAEERMIYGSDLKAAAADYLAEQGIFNTILVSEKRAYFPCAEKIYTTPKKPNDWNTIKVACGSPASWSISLRTQKVAHSGGDTHDTATENSVKIAFTRRNIPKGKVIQSDDLVMKWANSRSSHGAFITIENIVGHKAKRNMARDTVLKAQHILANNAVNKNDTILIISGSAGLSIVTYGEALSDGKVGDMVLVKNSSSNKKFKAIVTAEKKVSPITNIN